MDFGGGVSTAAWLPLDMLACLSHLFKWVGLIVGNSPRYGRRSPADDNHAGVFSSELAQRAIRSGRLRRRVKLSLGKINNARDERSYWHHLECNRIGFLSDLLRRFGGRRC